MCGLGRVLNAEKLTSVKASSDYYCNTFKHKQSEDY